MNQLEFSFMNDNPYCIHCGVYPCEPSADICIVCLEESREVPDDHRLFGPSGNDFIGDLSEGN